MMKNNPASNPVVRVLLVDDHHIVRKGLAALLEMEGGFEVVAEAKDGEEALQRAGEVETDVVILDLSMPRLNGIETARRLKRQDPNLPILILSMYDDEEFVAQALHAGASGYILKRSMEDELFLGLRAAVAGNVFVSPAIARPIVDKFLHEMNPKVNGTQLTSREVEILQLIFEGHTTAEIAEILSISVNTAGRHRSNLMQKLNVRNQAELIRVAIEKGLIVLNRNYRPLSEPGNSLNGEK